MNLKQLRKDIVKHLSISNYSPEVDDLQIDIIIDSFEFNDQCLADIRVNGLMQTVTGRNGVGYTKMNPAFGVLQMGYRNIQQACSKLGINRSDRVKLKLDISKEQSSIDKLKDQYQ